MRLLIFTLFILFQFSASAEYLYVGKFSPNKTWSKTTKEKNLNLKILFQTLAKSKTGRKLIAKANSKAKAKNLTLYDIVDEGKGSLTDTTLTRRFRLGHLDKVRYETTSKVFINKSLTQYDALLDLAHELTHFVFRKNFNPYRKNFTLSEFITNTIEGAGGEVQAFMMECKIHNELFSSHRATRFNCKQITDKETGKLSFSLAVSRFYQIGKYYENFVSVLSEHGIKENFPNITSSSVSFVSSAYGIPYPVAAFEEYLSVLNKVCENDKRRVAYFKADKGRAPASIKSFERSYKSRCQDTFD